MAKVGLAIGQAQDWPKSVEKLAKVGLAKVGLAKVGHDPLRFNLQVGIRSTILWILLKGIFTVTNWPAFFGKDNGRMC